MSSLVAAGIGRGLAAPEWIALNARRASTLFDEICNDRGIAPRRF
jgi:hypothetical protein